MRDFGPESARRLELPPDGASNVSDLTSESKLVRIILSRKGFDSTCGGVPSPIFPDGRPQSLPIPDRRPFLTFGEIQFGDGSVGETVEQLTRGRITREHHAHLDPDINARSLPRARGWRPLFGQAGAAQSHLAGHDVGPRDLFLFFGWFRQTERSNGSLRYVPGAPDLHLIFGWMQVGEVWQVGAERRRAPLWAAYHPHLRVGFSANNTVYVAAEALRWPGVDQMLPGAGIFDHARPSLRLTAPGHTRSIWKLPRWFHPSDRPSALTYNGKPGRWSREGDHVLLRSAAQGQEFVLDTADYPEAISWAATLLMAASAYNL